MNKKENIKQGSSPSAFVGDLPLIRLWCKKVFSLFKTTGSKEDSRQRHSGMTLIYERHAFTLIELLVVVLIIGILAAIALPQYTKAVGKARVTQAIVSLKALIDAQEVYHLANQTMASDLSELDVEVLNTKDYSYKCNESPFVGDCGAIPQTDGLPVLEFVPSWGTMYANKHWCQVTDSTQSAAAKAKALEICKTLGPRDTDMLNEYYLVQ